MRFTAVPRFSVQPILLGVGFALLVVIAVATVWLAEQSAADAKRVVATINVQGKLSDLLLNVRRAESGQRGYLLTGRQAYLSDYRDAAPSVETNLTELRAMMGEYSERIPVLDQVAALARAKMAELAKTIDLHDSGQIEAALATVQSDEGLRSMNALRVLVERLLRGEERVLLARSDASRSNDARLLTVTLAGLVLIVLIGALSVFLVQRTFRQREAARNELAAANANLERIVAHRTADLTEANEEIQRFAYIVSHDLRSPLVNIMGFTTELEALRNDIFEEIAKLREQAGVAAAPADPLGADFDEAIAFIKTSITKMDRLINAVLKLSREGRRDFQPDDIDMNALLASIGQTVAHRASEQGATITVADLPPVMSDPLALEQVFSNLVDNALKYGRQGEPGRIEIRGRATPTQVTYEVRDNGRGIDPHDHQRVFELFRRSGPQDRPGEGIGLAHVRTLVRRLGGTMSLTSELGKGSVFTVTLPRRWIGENRSVA
ncbi:MAG: sensor histidine kinase [Xanthobacteraceae bacterium]